jgi:hypothetical protein
MIWSNKRSDSFIEGETGIENTEKFTRSSSQTLKASSSLSESKMKMSESHGRRVSVSRSPSRTLSRASSLMNESISEQEILSPFPLSRQNLSRSNSRESPSSQSPTRSESGNLYKLSRQLSSKAILVEKATGYVHKQGSNTKKQKPKTQIAGTGAVSLLNGFVDDILSKSTTVALSRQKSDVNISPTEYVPPLSIHNTYTQAAFIKFARICFKKITAIILV